LGHTAGCTGRIGFLTEQQQEEEKKERERKRERVNPQKVAAPPKITEDDRRL
jgi:hypothetical protein